MEGGKWLVMLLVAATWHRLDACSCMPYHPQTHYCQSDFVIVGQVERLFKAKDQGHQDIYKVKIRKILKATPKAQVALRAGRLISPSEDSMCGVSLQPKEPYLITGRISELQAHVNLCSFTSKLRELTPRQRQGFRKLYKLGCTCKVKIAMSSYQSRQPSSHNTCRSRFYDCYQRHGVCLHVARQNGRCMWTRPPKLTRCLQIQRMNGTIT